ncbi:GNAT family N-acetyltransferase [Photobacterium sanctipauli]|uniref:GNAT family N-acetyltransferase n=1 Tax=Photobacterium sanctipauli TaxID=1342794 RepID=A0A2T3NWM3_9GAMM|nr:GNAT family N-acetyltransferase [Photobacterium sanctipauli]PSW20693.1 GNAT family N-acetyltransferase [Photobacterium sanctipauli]
MDIVIRHVEKSDFADLQKILSGANAYSGTLQLPYPSLDMWQQRIENRPSNMYGLVAELDNEVVGEISLSVQVNPRRKHVADMGMAVRDDKQGLGIGSRLLAAMIDLAQNWLSISRMELTVYTDNAAAIALYEKHGFVIEGHAKKYAFRNGEYVDVYHMARLTD